MDHLGGVLGTGGVSNPDGLLCLTLPGHKLQVEPPSETRRDLRVRKIFHLRSDIIVQLGLRLNHTSKWVSRLPRDRSQILQSADFQSQSCICILTDYSSKIVLDHGLLVCHSRKVRCNGQAVN